jgi:hypothetical protein
MQCGREIAQASVFQQHRMSSELGGMVEVSSERGLALMLA